MRPAWDIRLAAHSSDCVTWDGHATRATPWVGGRIVTRTTSEAASADSGANQREIGQTRGEGTSPCAAAALTTDGATVRTIRSASATTHGKSACPATAAAPTSPMDTGDVCAAIRNH
mmetsp:Transcript_5059/g.11682  ORF Transcript_5059/g.11682 Transcript_5059/m.11682 type:complete len:117 (+) Transcript_5059:208-558(+)